MESHAPAAFGEIERDDPAQSLRGAGHEHGAVVLVLRHGVELEMVAKRKGETTGEGDAKPTLGERLWANKGCTFSSRSRGLVTPKRR